jgi:hypothetical protein
MNTDYEQERKFVGEAAGASAAFFCAEFLSWGKNGAIL